MTEFHAMIRRAASGWSGRAMASSVSPRDGSGWKWHSARASVNSHARSVPGSLSSATRAPAWTSASHTAVCAVLAVAEREPAVLKQRLRVRVIQLPGRIRGARVQGRGYIG